MDKKDNPKLRTTDHIANLRCNNDYSYKEESCLEHAKDYSAQDPAGLTILQRWGSCSAENPAYMILGHFVSGIC